ncbi:presenilin family protein [Pelomyxa schiedti]|nr:presenilin family protein [Pelomyxa schiedti]
MSGEVDLDDEIARARLNVPPMPQCPGWCPRWGRSPARSPSPPPPPPPHEGRGPPPHAPPPPAAVAMHPTHHAAPALPGPPTGSTSKQRGGGASEGGEDSDEDDPDVLEDKPRRRGGDGEGEGEEGEEGGEAEPQTPREYSVAVVGVLWPVAVTMENSEDSNTKKFTGAFMNALIFVGVILITTVGVVILYKLNCIKLIVIWLVVTSGLMLGCFGGYLFYLILDAANWPLDWISFMFFSWNFTAVGLVSLFWVAPTLLNHIYLIIISFLMATYLTKLPEWTTWGILIIVALYDLFAVLCPKGPLRILVETAQQRDQPIPALLYNASVLLMMANSPTSSATPQTQPPPTPQVKKKHKKGLKLGLGDFVFYSVLIGRAALFDMLTVFTCFVAIITGLFCTLVLLAIFRKALPALPISIGFGVMFYFLTRIFFMPFIVTLQMAQVFI